MRRCLTCNGRFDPRRLNCPVDRDLLIDEGLPAPETGRILADRYRLGNQLGEGGMGKVFEAECLESGESVAVKLLKLDAAKSDQERATAEKRFRREAEAMASLQSPGIVKTYEFGETQQGESYLVLERLLGGTFDELRRAGKLADVQRVIDLLREVCEILDVAHKNGIVHRDLKPSNLFLHRLDKEHSRVKILDFGIAKFVEGSAEHLTSTGEFLGTLLYMAPEQASGRPVTQALDVYTLGVILFEMLAGRAPFGARNPLELLRLHASMPAPSLRSIRPDISTELDEIVARCLRKKPAQRYPDAGALAYALTSVRTVFSRDELLERTSTFQTNASSWVGSVLDERYELEEWVARGRFGSDVYRAIHLRSGADLAVRLWRTGTGPIRDCLLDAFRSEAKAMGVHHPNVITIVDLGFNEDSVYIVTELIASTSLRELLGREGPLPARAAWRLVRGATEGLGALHARGIVSGGMSPETLRVTAGDCGPENILLSPFGLKNVRQIQLLLQQFGTLDIDDRCLDYISPEQKAGAEPDQRSDLYSLGIVALEMLGGTCETSPAAATRTLTEVRKGPLPEAPGGEPGAASAAVLKPTRWKLPGGLPAPTREFLGRATAVEPEARFATVAEFLEALPAT